MDDRFIEICLNGADKELAAAIADGADVNTIGKFRMSPLTPLVAAILSDKEFVEKTALLLQAGADPDFYEAEKTGSTRPICAAAGRGKVPLVSMLLEAGVEINSGEERHHIPLIRACVTFPGDTKTEAVRRELIQLFLDKGADLAFNDSGTGCLVLAADDAEPETLELLLNAGIPVDARLYDGGMTALMTAAAFNSNPRTVALLLERGADPGLRNWEDATALDFARGKPGGAWPNGNETPAAGEIIRLLEAAQKQ